MYLPRWGHTALNLLAKRNHVNYPSHHPTTLKKRSLINDPLPAHMIPIHPESSEDVIYTYTWHTKSKLWPEVFPSSGRATSQMGEAPSPCCETGYLIERMKGVSKIPNPKIPKGQVYMRRLEPTEAIRLADTNHRHYPSRQPTILKKRPPNDRPPAHIISSTLQWWEDETHPYT